MFTADDVIHSYTRQQAIADGVLVELDPKLCQEAGIRFPVAIYGECTPRLKAAWKQYQKKTEYFR